MSSTSSNSPRLEMVDELRKKGLKLDLKTGRNGKRSVTHLSKAQLLRKRANDREAQRNIRQRTKEHIENLEHKVRQLELEAAPCHLERLMCRNQELEAEVERLRAQVSARVPASVLVPVPTPAPATIPPDLADDLMMPVKSELGWMSAAEWASHFATIKEASDLTTSSVSYPSSEAPSYNAPSYEDETPQTLYAANASPAWNEAAVFPGTASRSLSKSTQAWSAFPSGYSQTSTFSSLTQSQQQQEHHHLQHEQQNSFHEIASQPTSPSTYTPPSWQSPTSIYAWQLPSTSKLKAPSDTCFDQFSFNMQTIPPMVVKAL